MNTDEQAVLQIINTYAEESASWRVAIEELCKLTSLGRAELMQTMDMLKGEGYINMQTAGNLLEITITHDGREAALDAPQF